MTGTGKTSDRREVMVILRFPGEVDELLERWERAVQRWQELYPDSRLPASIASEAENGGLVVVNVFGSDEDHLRFGQKMGTPLREVGLDTPGMEHLAVRRIDWDATRLD
jgi:hypothetical protein